MIFFAEAVPQVAINALMKILVQCVIMVGIWTLSDLKIQLVVQFRHKNYALTNANQDSFLQMIQIIGSAFNAWINVKSATIQHIVRSAQKDMCCR